MSGTNSTQVIGILVAAFAFSEVSRVHSGAGSVLAVACLGSQLLAVLIHFGSAADAAVVVGLKTAEAGSVICVIFVGTCLMDVLAIFEGGILTVFVHRHVAVNTAGILFSETAGAGIIVSGTDIFIRNMLAVACLSSQLLAVFIHFGVATQAAVVVGLKTADTGEVICIIQLSGIGLMDVLARSPNGVGALCGYRLVTDSTPVKRILVAAGAGVVIGCLLLSAGSMDTVACLVFNYIALCVEICPAGGAKTVLHFVTAAALSVVSRPQIAQLVVSGGFHGSDQIAGIVTGCVASSTEIVIDIVAAHTGSVNGGAIKSAAGSMAGSLTLADRSLCRYGQRHSAQAQHQTENDG